jgi:putative peptidoglycan lipid II flippase
VTVAAASLPRRRSLGRIMTSIAPVSLGVQLASFVSSLALARVLGATVATDAYYLGLAIPALTYGLLLGALRNGAIPSLTNIATASGEEALRRSAGELLSGVIVASAALTVLVTGLFEAMLPLFVGGRLLELTRLIALELAPYTMLGSVAGLLIAVLAVRGVFVVPIAVMAFEPLTKAALTVALGHQIGVQSLIAGNLLGSFLALAMLWYMVTRQGIVLRVGRRFNTPFVRETARISIPLIAGSSILLVNPIVDRTMASDLGSGSVTALELGLRLVMPFGVLSTLLTGPIVATWSVRKVEGGWPALRASATRVLDAAAAILPPLVVLGFMLRHQIVTLVFQGGAYPAEALHDTTSVFGMIMLGLPAEMLIVLVSMIFLVHGDTIFPLKIACANIVLNVVLNFAFRPLFGVAGIALGTSVTYSILLVALALAAYRRWGAFYTGKISPVLIRAAASAGATAGTAVILISAFPPTSSRVMGLLVLVIVGTAGVLVHATVLTVGRDPFALSAAGRVRRLLIWTSR